MRYDFIIVGSGAGGCASAYHLAQCGQRVLLLERGGRLPDDGSTLDVERVFARGQFLDDEVWRDGAGRPLVPQERANLGGKTRWYGAALLRFAPHEFAAEPDFQCRAWPFGYEELAPFYDEAETLLGVRRFGIEAQLQQIVSGLRRRDPAWQRQPLPMALAPDILDYPIEARHFDGFASPRGLKGDGQRLLARLRPGARLTVLTDTTVVGLLPTGPNPRRVAGVLCQDGTRHEADVVILAGGALHSPRLLETYVRSTGLDAALPGADLIGRHYKAHLLSALLAYSPRPKRDVLRKTTVLLHERLPHSSVQPLGWIDEALFAAEAPAAMPRWLARHLGARVYGFFLQTEDGSHADNRVRAAGADPRPVLDYDPRRLPRAHAEHAALRRTLARQLARLGYLPLLKTIPLAGTAHACGTLIAGRDPACAVVDADGRVHGLDNLYVADGSVLARSSRVNPALSIYAWALRLASRLAGRRPPERAASTPADPQEQSR